MTKHKECPRCDGSLHFDPVHDSYHCARCPGLPYWTAFGLESAGRGEVVARLDWVARVKRGEGTPEEVKALAELFTNTRYTMEREWKDIASQPY